jgi:hypothetical protein
LLQGKTKGKEPEVVRGKRIAVTSIQKHGATAILEVADTTLSNPILVVGVNATEGNGLIGGINGGPEFLGCNNTVDTVVVVDGNMMTLSEALKSFLGFNGVIGRGGSLGVDVVESRGVVHEDCGDVMSFMFAFPGGLGDKPGGFGDQLVHKDHIARLKLVLG